MKENPIVEDLQKIVMDYLAAQGYELVELACFNQGPRTNVRILVDACERSITIDECARINRALADIIEERNIFSSSYVLEVCSPGLDRPLKQKKDFLKCINKPVKCFLNQAINGKIEWDGVVMGVGENSLCLSTLQAQVLDIPWTALHKAVRIIK